MKLASLFSSKDDRIWIIADQAEEIQLNIPGSYGFRAGQQQVKMSPKFKWISRYRLPMSIVLMVPLLFFLFILFNSFPQKDYWIVFLFYIYSFSGMALMYSLGHLFPRQQVIFKLKNDCLYIMQVDKTASPWLCLHMGDIQHLELAESHFMRFHYFHDHKSLWWPVPESFSLQLQQQMERGRSGLISRVSLNMPQKLLLFISVSISALLIVNLIVALEYFNILSISDELPIIAFLGLILTGYISYILYLLLQSQCHLHLCLSEHSLRAYRRVSFNYKQINFRDWDWSDITRIEPIFFGFRLHLSVDCLSEGEVLSMNSTIKLHGFFRHQVEQLIQHHEAWKRDQG